MNKANIESKEDFQNYLTHLSQIAKEVDQWPEEYKSQRATSLHAYLTPQEEKTELQPSTETNSSSKNNFPIAPSVDL